ncbi:MAG: A/G-specific adenine glycosylase [Legionellales bacterium]|nr:A/G-specific adenine glycosylase [Legionellales bacterium]
MNPENVLPYFSEPLLSWFDIHGRHDLPWQTPRNAYRVLISEVMLQQTQVMTVIPYFERFMERFPNVSSLANATLDDVLAHWSGLGYYSRARNLHQSARIIDNQWHGELPSQIDDLIKLPGIGPSTAAAIASLAFNKPTAILDGNVKRVLSRFFLISGIPSKASVHEQFMQKAQVCMPTIRSADYTQAIMDLGATICTSKHPQCSKCPIHANCMARINQVIQDYPSKAPKKTRPIVEQQFLLLHTEDNKIYLERRPLRGIWGGLWCFPSIEMNQCPVNYVLKTYHLETNPLKEFATIKHPFTHFHLHIKAIVLSIKSETLLKASQPPCGPKHRRTLPGPPSILRAPSPHVLGEGNKEGSYSEGRWFSPIELKTIGLAKPVKTIINSAINGPIGALI